MDTTQVLTHRFVFMAHSILEAAVESGRYDLLTPYPDGWVSIAETDQMARDGYEVLADNAFVQIPEEREGLQTIPAYELGPYIIAWHGGYYAASLGED